MSALVEQLHALLPNLSHAGHQVLAAVANQTGLIGGVRLLLPQLGIKSRHSLARLLQREGLPPIEELCGWMTVLFLLYNHEQTHTSLYQLALQNRRNPPTCYRTIKRITGKTWGQAVSEGFNYALISFLQRCGDVRRSRTANSAKGLLAGQHPPLQRIQASLH